MFMKLAALQLMQQKANKPSSPSVGNGSSPTTFPENGVEDKETSLLEDSKMEDNTPGLEQVKELTETIASDDGAGIDSCGGNPFWHLPFPHTRWFY